MTRGQRWRHAWRDFAIWHRLDWDMSGRSPEKVPGRSLLRMFGYLSPLWPWIVGVLVFSFGAIALGVVPAFITKEIINQALTHHKMAVLLHLVALLGGVMVLSTLMSAVGSYLHGVLSNRVVRDLRSDLFSRVLRQSPEERAAIGREDTTTRVINDVGIASTGFSVLGWRPEAMTGVVGFLNMTLGFVTNGWKVVVTAAALFALDWRFAMVFVIALPPFFLLTRLVGRVLYTLSQQEYGGMGRLNATLMRSTGWVGSSWAKLFGQEPRYREQFLRENAKISETSIASRIISDAHHMSYTFPVAVATVFIWFYGGIQVMHHTMSLGTLIAFAGLLTKNTYTFSNFIGAFVFFPHLRGVLDRIFAMWPAGEATNLTLRRRRPRVSRRPSLVHWLRDTGVRLSAPPALGYSSLRRLLSFMLPYWPYFLMVLADAIISVAGLGALVPLFQRQIIDSAIPHHNVGQLRFAVLMIALFPFVHLFSAELSSTGHEFLGHRSLQRLRNWAYDRLGAVAGAGTTNIAEEQAMSRVLNDVNGLYSAYGELSNLTWLFLPIIPALVLMTALSWRLGVLIVLVTLPFVALLRYGGQLFYAINRRIFETVEDLNTFTLDSLDASRLGSHRRQDREDLEHRFAEKNESLADLGLTSSVAHGWFGDLFGLHYSLITVLLWLVGGSMIIHGQLLLGTLVAVMAYAGKIEGFGGGFGVYLVVRTMQANADRVFSLCEQLGTLGPAPAPSGPPVPEGIALKVENLRVDESGRYDWNQPPRTVCALEAGVAGDRLLEVLAGLRSPLAGEVWRAQEGRVALVSADAPLPPISPQEILSVAHGSQLSPAATQELLAAVGLGDLRPDAAVPSYLDGQAKRRLSLAAAILWAPELVLADRLTVDGRALRDLFPTSTVVGLRDGQKVQTDVAAGRVDQIVRPLQVPA